MSSSRRVYLQRREYTVDVHETRRQKEEEAVQALEGTRRARVPVSDYANAKGLGAQPVHQEGQTVDLRVGEERVDTKVSYNELPNSPLVERGVQTLSVIIPAKNEERNLLPLIELLFSALRGIGRPFDAIVVNDGSTDGSLRVLRELVSARLRPCSGNRPSTMSRSPTRRDGTRMS